MAVRNNKAALRIVKDWAPPSGAIEILVIDADAPRRVRIEERDVAIPQVSVFLADACISGRWAATKRGQIIVDLPVLWRGSKRIVSGYVDVPEGADVVLPRGTLAKWHAQAT